MPVGKQKLWLVQRLRGPRDLHKRGGFTFCFGGGSSGLSKDVEKVLAQFFTPDYMGSAEYEYWGAHCQVSFAHTFDHCCKNMDKYELFETEFNEVPVWILCPKENIEVVVNDLVELADKPDESTRDCSFFAETLKRSKEDTPDADAFAPDYLGWTDIENHFFWFVDEEMARGVEDCLRHPEKYFDLSEEETCTD